VTIRVENAKLWQDFSHVVLREADAWECAAGGLTPEEALRKSAERSNEAWAISVDEKLCAIWGYSGGLLSSTCHAWLLTTPEVERHPVRFLRSSRRIVSHLLTLYPSVMVLVHRPYIKAVAWLSWLGFDRVASDDTFHLMERRR